MTRKPKVTLTKLELLHRELAEKVHDYRIAINDGHRELAQIYQIEANTLPAKIDRIN